MTDQPAGPRHGAFHRLAAQHELSDLDRKLIDAYDRLVNGRSATTDGSLTVANMCAEAGVSRASYYRSPVATTVKELLASGQATRPEIDKLRTQVRDLKAADADNRRQHAEEIRDLKATVATYANQIQILALRNAELEADNQRLRTHLDRQHADVISLNTPPHSPDSGRGVTQRKTSAARLRAGGARRGPRRPVGVSG